MKKDARHKRDERGFVLVTVYFLLMILSAAAIAIFTQSTNFFQNADSNRKRVVAFNIAEAGVDTVFLQLKNGTITTFPYSTGYVSMNSGSVRGGYSVTVSDMGSGVRKIVATGYSPVQSSSLESVENRVITGYVTSTSNPLFNFAAFGKSSVIFSGNATIDSYNSALGAYGTSNKSSAGNVGTDAITAASVALSGNATIKGNVTTGPGSNPSSVISISGNGISTASNLPSNTIIYATGSSAISVSGNGNFYGAIYAPNATVMNSGNGEIFGSVMGGHYIQTGNGNVRFDTSLKTIGATNGLNMLSWKEN